MVFRLDSAEDMRASILENFERLRAYYQRSGIATSITKQGTWKINGVDFGYVDEENKSPKGRTRYRFFFRRIDDAFWLYGKIAGHKKWAFEEAMKILKGMKCNVDR